MTTGAKIGLAIGVAVAITVAVILYKTMNKVAEPNAQQAGLPEYIDELVEIMKKNNPTPTNSQQQFLASAQEAMLRTNAKKASVTELGNFLKIAKKAEKDWTADEKKMFQTISLKYNLKIGG